jgi:chemotaxis protein CheX
LSAAARKTAHKAAPAEPVRLAEVLDAPALEALVKTLRDRRGAPLQLDASGVRRMGGLALQVLLSARNTWAADGQALSVTDPSAPFWEALTLFGAAAFGDEPVE